MDSGSGNIYACCRSGVAILRVCGRAQADHCPALRRFAEAALAGEASAIHVDLSACEHFDSTFLGTLLHLRRARDAALTLLAPSDSCVQLLARMGAKALFRIDHPHGEPDAEDWLVLVDDGSGRGGLEFKRNVVEAHQELARVEGPLGDRYRMIAEMAAEDLANAQRPR